MALKKNFAFDTKYGVQAVVSECYIKVDRVETSKRNCTATVAFYQSDKSVLLEELRYEFPPILDGENFIAQAYAHLKTLPEFAGVIDC